MYTPNDAAPPSKAEKLGTYMVLQFLPDGHWQLRPADLAVYVADIAPGHRALVQDWILFYIAWLFRLYVAGRFGNAVAREMMDAIYYRTAQNDDMKALGANIEAWFNQLDAAGAAVRRGLKIGGLDVPSTVYAAMRFMSADPESPCYEGKNTDDPFSDQVMAVIAKVHDDMLTPIGAAVDTFG
jgi:hypothetical protein